MKASSLVSTAFVLLAASCQAGADVVETRFLRIELERDAPLCAGTLLDLDSHVESASERMGLTPRQRVQARLGPDTVASCTDGATGCVGGWGDEVWIVAADRSALDHEIVHALRRQHEVWGSPSAEEGIAELLSAREGVRLGWALREKELGPAALWGMSLDEVLARDGAYVASANVVAWMSSAYGDDAVMAVFRSQAFRRGKPLSAIDAELSAALGESLEEIDARWFAEAPLVQHAGSVCDESEVRTLGDGVQWSGTLSCDDEDALGAYETEDNPRVISRVRCLRLSVPTKVMVSADADRGHVLMTSVDPCPVEPWEWSAMIEAGESQELDLAACDWALRWRVDGLDAVDWTVAVAPAG